MVLLLFFSSFVCYIRADSVASGIVFCKWQACRIFYVYKCVYCISIGRGNCFGWKEGVGEKKWFEAFVLLAGIVLSGSRTSIRRF